MYGLTLDKTDRSTVLKAYISQKVKGAVKSVRRLRPLITPSVNGSKLFVIFFRAYIPVNYIYNGLIYYDIVNNAYIH